MSGRMTGPSWMRRGRAIAAAVACVLLVGVAAATTLKRMTLGDVASQSTAIVVGTVRTTLNVAGPDQRAFVLTQVELEKLDVWHGAVPGSTVSYRFAGGELGDRKLTVLGVPQLAVGGRYVLFVDPDSDAICPTVGWTQGVYELRRDARTGIEHVHDADGHLVYGFADGLPVRKASKERPRPLTAVELQVEVTRVLEAAAREAEERPSTPETPETEEEKPRANDDRPPPPPEQEDAR